MRLVVTGGGTGGHVYPAIAVANAWMGIGPDHDALFVGAEGGMEARAAHAAGLPFEGIAATKLPPHFGPATFRALAATLRGTLQARRALVRARPAAVVSTGGYAGAAAACAAITMRVPVVLVEPNAVAGRATRWLGRWARRVCVAFEEAAAWFPRERTIVTGAPIRAGIVSRVDEGSARAHFGLPGEGIVLLVVGGSQGARTLNQAVAGALSALPEAVAVLHQTGLTDAEEARARAAAAGLAPPRYVARTYLELADMPLAYAAASLVFCRCGASSLAEATANGLPAIMTPLPTAFADHQTANARSLVRAGGGVLLAQRDLTPERLAEIAWGIAGDRERLRAMSDASRAVGRPDAADRVARVAQEVAR
ncbi:MAG TPA: undecaprenyldiphospho-muramoylpentapeptide beta-N-acetylglucosaminyltransferase [Chthonomonadales bacterium]|nr:undecaprenyldiphospho-muramoylpentapeptide beta-N-acetylglucosaminyltransferase [Chthonomonadales bacterium]